MAQVWQKELDAFADLQAQQRRADSARPWRSWVAAALEGGAAAAHAMPNKVGGPAPEPVCKRTEMPASASAEVEAEAEEWYRLWRTSEEAADLAWPPPAFEPLERLSVERL